MTMTKRLLIGRDEWFIADADAEDVIREVRNAMANHATVELQLYDPAGHGATVFLNGAAAATVALTLASGPRPSEMSASPGA